MTEETDREVNNKMDRKWFAIQILAGLMAHQGGPGPGYLSDLPREDGEVMESTAEYLKERAEYLRSLETYNRRAICRQAVKLADELILQLSLPAAP